MRRTRTAERKQAEKDTAQPDELRKLMSRIAAARAESRRLVAKLVLADYNAARLGIDPEELLRPITEEPASDVRDPASARASRGRTRGEKRRAIGYERDTSGGTDVTDQSGERGG